MQLRALRYFNQVAQSSSLRDAAEKLFVTPTAVTRQIELLEHYYGASLIERSPRGIRLTAEGEHLALAVQSCLRELEGVKDKISSAQSQVSGKVRISCAESLISSLIIPAIERFRLRHPDVRFEIDIGSAPRVAEALVGDRADVAVSFYMPALSGLNVTHSCSVQHQVLMSPTHPLSGSSGLTLREIAGFPIAAPASGFAVRQSLETAAKREGIFLDIRFVTSSIEIQKQLCRQGLALIILPKMTLAEKEPPEDLVAIPLNDPLMGIVRIDLGLPAQRTLSRAVKLFHETLGQYIEAQLSPAITC